MNKRIFPFRFKLTLLVTLITLVLLIGIYFAVQNVLEKEFVSSIKSELQKSEKRVERFMRERLNLLYSQTTILSGNRIIREILLDTNMDRVTANDLIQQEVLANFPDLDTLIVVSSEGDLLGTDTLGQTIKQPLLNLDKIKLSLNGESISTHLFHKNEVIQVFGLPVFQRESLIGVLFAGIRLNHQTLKQLHNLSDAELIFFQQQQVFLATQWTRKSQRQAMLDQLNQSVIKENHKLQQTTLLNERFLYLYSEDAKPLSPPYLISISLDKKLAFSQAIYQDILLIGFIGLVIGTFLSFIFARSVSRPIHLLEDQTLEVEKANYASRINIQSNDEFYYLGQSFNKMVSGLEEREKIRAAMNKVVSKEIATLMLAGDIQLGGEERLSSILFSDIRGFTQLSEQLPANDLLTLLNRYFTQMSRCIDQHQGVIDKYIGDAVMALFGLPVIDDHQAYHAVLSALAMIKSLHEFNQTSSHKLRIGIGINTGKVVAGNMGADNRLNYTVLGNEVNFASRLESLTKHYHADILISQSTFDAIQLSHPQMNIDFRYLDQVQVKGQSTGVGIYQVINATQKGLMSSLTDFSQARQLMMQASFEMAQDKFTQLTKKFPLDHTLQVYKNKCEQYATDPNRFYRDYNNGVFIQRKK